MSRNRRAPVTDRQIIRTLQILRFEGLESGRFEPLSDREGLYLHMFEAGLRPDREDFIVSKILLHLEAALLEMDDEHADLTHPFTPTPETAISPGMSLPHALTGLSDIAADYDILLCDVWGVIHNGRESWPAACEALARFNRDHGHVVLISNSPRPSSDVVAQLDGLGVPRDSWRAFVTSGDATRAELARRAPGPAWVIGPDRDWPLYEGLGLDSAHDAADAAFISVTGPVDDETETPEDYRERLAAGAARDLELICANPDRVVQRGDRLIYCGGALADLYESLGGRVTMAGKPFGPIYDLAVKEGERLLGRPVNRARVLCIGDGVVTDVLGANRQALDCLFIAQGIHGDAARGPDGRLDPARAADLLKAETTYARYAALDLTW